MSGFNSSSQDGGDKATSPPDEPLTLTVHGLPSLAPEGVGRVINRRAGRLKMFLVFLVAMAPVALSYFTYYVIRPQGRTNYGELIQPMRMVPSGLMGVDVEGKPVALDSLRNQWLLISVSPSACDKACETNLYLQRQTREALGREKDRVDWVWLRTDDAPLSPEIRDATARATVLRVNPAELAQWMEPQAGQSFESHLYLVDPMGNWMMRFPPQPEPAKMRKDLERLLRASSSWDREGR